MTNLATPVEVATYLAINPDTLRQWAHRRQGPPYIMVEGARRYRWSDIHAWLDAKTVKHS